MMRAHILALILPALLQVSGQPSPSEYGAMSAEKKADTIWSLLTADEAGGQFMNPVETLLYASNPTYLSKMQSTAYDWREPTHKKITHGIGAHARGHISWLPNNYSGMFQKADHCIVRMANAAMPGTVAMTAYGPNLAIKCLTDAGGYEATSANLLAIWQLDGYAELPTGKKKSCSYFEAPLSAHTPLRDDIAAALRDTFVQDFQKVDPHSMLIGVSQFAAVNQDGTVRPGVAPPGTQISFPFDLVYKARPGLNAAPCVFDKYISQLQHVPSFSNGTDLFDIYAIDKPWATRPNGAPDVNKIGTLTLDTPFVGSTFGDTRLFFRHSFFGTELETLIQNGQQDRAVEWLRYTNNTEFMKTEGAMLYEPFLK
eukprot:SAG31_NODE_2523_length_5562_cov_4.427238_4_plen_370_part_00